MYVWKSENKSDDDKQIHKCTNTATFKFVLFLFKIIHLTGNFGYLFMILILHTFLSYLFSYLAQFEAPICYQKTILIFNQGNTRHFMKCRGNFPPVI